MNPAVEQSIHLQKAFKSHLSSVTQSKESDFKALQNDNLAEMISLNKHHPATFNNVIRLLLLRACAEGIVEVVSIILCTFGKRTADFFGPVEYDAGKNGFGFDTICNQVDPIKLSNCRKSTFLHMAAENGHYDIVCTLLEKGSKINAADCCGRTPLMLSLMHPKIAKFLVGNGACVNHQDKQGHTVLIQLVMSSQSPPDSTDLDLFDFILKSGANPALTDQSGQSIVHHTLSKECRSPFYEILFENGIIPTCSEAGMLMYADNPLCMSDISYDFVEYLLPTDKIPLDLKVSLKYFSFICKASQQHLYQTNVDELLASLQNVLEFKASSNVMIKYPSSSFVEEFRDSRLISKETFFQLLFQILVMAERVYGYGSFKVIQLLLQNNRMKMPDKCVLLPSQKIEFLTRASEMILFRVRKHKIDWDALRLILLALDPKIFPNFINEKSTAQLVPFFENVFQSINIFLSSLKTFHCHQHSLKGSFVHTIPYNCTIKDLYYKSLTLALHLVSKKDFSEHVDVIGRIMFSNIQTVWLPDTDISIFPWLFADNSADSFLTRVLEWGGERWINVPNISQRYLLHSVVKKPSEYTRLCVLLHHGAHPDVWGRSVGTPLMLAKRKKNEKAIKLLNTYYPLPLSCHAASVIANKINNYQFLDLPRKIKAFISLHDCNGVSKGIDYTALLIQ